MIPYSTHTHPERRARPSLLILSEAICEGGVGICLVGPDGLLGRMIKEKGDYKGAICKTADGLVQHFIHCQLSSWSRTTMRIDGKHILAGLWGRTSSSKKSWLHREWCSVRHAGSVRNATAAHHYVQLWLYMLRAFGKSPRRYLVCSAAVPPW